MLKDSRTIWGAIFLLFSVLARGQADLGSATLPGAWQATYANPAVFPDHRVVFALPGFYGNISSTSFAWGDLISEGSGGRKRIDPDRLIGRLEDHNVLRVQSDLPLLGIGISVKKWLLSAGVQVRASARIAFPRTLAELLWRGNAGFIGETIELGPELNSSLFNESFIGLAFQPGPKLSFGGRVKLLNGLFNVSTTSHRLFLGTGVDAYELLLDADYRINTTADFTYTGLDSLRLGVVRPEISRLFGDNPGFAIDFGIRYQSGPLVLQASVLDLGKLHWKKDARSLQVDGTFEFKGMDIFRQLLDGSGSGPIQLLDSLEAQYEVRQSSGTYQTWLPVRVFGSAAFDFNDFVQGTGTLLLEVDGSYLHTALALGGRLKVGKWANLGLLYAIRHGRANHLGLNAVLNAGPLQIVAATDHLGAWLAPENARATNLRLGMNLIFGRVRAEK